MRNVLRRLFPVVDFCYLPIAIVIALLAKPYSLASRHMTWSRGILDRFGLSILRNHYYGPVVLPTDIRWSLREDRNLDFINFRLDTQLELLSKINILAEISDITEQEINGIRFDPGNGNFGLGDFEIYYSLIRHFKPGKIIEIGSGHSTVIASLAARRNGMDGTETEITAIEPFEQPWLEQLGINVVRQKVEDLGKEPFEALAENDILFIDSSHVIRPQGDVLFNFFSLLPRLQPGVIVHLHDIFTPFDYPDKWVLEERRLWDEQYLLEAFLAYNDEFEVLLANNYMKHKYYEPLKAVCPYLTPSAEPGSFWLRKIRPEPSNS
jgi:hypothetical protein